MHKHHVQGMAAMAAAEAVASAARTPGAKVLLVDGVAVCSSGDASDAEMEAFAAWAFGPEADRLIAQVVEPEASPTERSSASSGSASRAA